MRVVIKIGGSLIKEAPGLVDRLIKEFGSLKDIYENLDKITKKSVKETLENNKELAEANSYTIRAKLAELEKRKELIK